jgi:hypothetical protein
MFGDDDLDMTSPAQVAEAYGGDKRKIGQAVQIGLLDPTIGVMAGMFIDRMRAAAVKEQQPNTTVAQDVMAPAMAPTMPAAGLAAAQPAPPVPQAPQQTVMAAGGGLMDLNVPDAMYDYAGGGIVAFQNEGFVDPIFSATPDEMMTAPSGGGEYQRFTGDMTLPELQEYYRSGKVPDRLKGQEPRGFGSRGAPLLGDFVFSPPKPTRTREERSTDSVVPAAPSRRQADTKAEDKDVVDRKKEEAAQKPAAEPTDYAAMVETLKRRFGVSDTPDAAAREALSKYRERLDKDISKAGALGMIQAGLGIAGGKSRYALQNLAGAVPGISEYAKSLEGIRREERGLIDAEAKLDEAANARRRGDMDTAIRLEKEAKELGLREQGLEVQRRQAAASERQAGRVAPQVEYVREYAKAKGISFDQAAREIAEMQGEARNPMNAILADRFRSAAQGGRGQIDIRDLMEKYPGFTPTR